MRIRAGVAILCLSASGVCAWGQNAAFVETLKKNSAGIGVQSGRLSGPGAEVLTPALADAHFVLLGEDHGIQQIPEFAAALCTELVPHGFHHMALEIGPNVAPELEKMARSSDGLKELGAFTKKYPETIAFYNWREEFSMLQQCEKAGGSAGMTLWGVDQEFMGSAGLLLDKILATNPGPEAKAAMEALRKENDSDHEGAAKTGVPWDLFLMKTKKEDLEHARELLKRQGSPEAQKLMDAMIVSRDVYDKNKSGDYYASNRQRALLMKENFTAPFGTVMRKDGETPKVFFKFGGYHMYRGLNPMHSSELGNTANEFAEAHMLKTVHIMIFGVKGEQAHFAGIGKPSQAGPVDLTNEKDSDFAFLKPLFENQAANSWTIYDMRALRDKFSDYGKIDPEFERIIFGYDFVVLVPDPRASHDVD